MKGEFVYEMQDSTEGAGQNLRVKEQEIQIRLKKGKISNREINKLA